MTKLTILRGISGSGKTTYAERMQSENPGLVIVERDRLRSALFTTESFIDEPFINIVENSIVEFALKSGRSVVVSNTNTRVKYVNMFIDIAKACDVPWEVKLIDTPLDTALANNRLRARQGGRYVPENIIRQQYQTLQSNKDVKFT